jgi:two-component system sensor histidine kinase AtoS
MASATELHDTELVLDSSPGLNRFVASLSTLSTGNGAAGTLVIIRNIAPVDELEQAFARSRSLAQQERLLGAISHQIRDPLQVMFMQLDLLADDAGKSSPLLKHVTALKVEITRIKAAVGALLRFLRLGQPNLGLADLNALVRELIERERLLSIDVTYHLDTQLSAIEVDHALLSEALHNLVNNAVQAMTGGGSLEISTRSISNNYVELLIHDHGPGIPSELKERVFDLYFSTKDGGAGIGLPMARRIIEIHRGTLQIESFPGQGTIVLIRLPMRQAPSLR